MKTYGKVEFIAKDRTWVVKAQPHVVLRLKRVFAQLGKKSQGLHCFSDTPEFCRDMIWFMDRFPLEIRPLERSYLESEARRHKDRVTLVEQLVSGLIKPRAFEMAIPARDYQRVAAETVLSTGGLLLADELGTGKLQPIDAPVPTPKGWRTIGDLQIGDYAMGSRGTPIRVKGVFPQGKKKIYRVWFSDHSSCEVGDEHLWTVRYRRGGRHWVDIVLTTEQLRTRPKVKFVHANGCSAPLDLAKTVFYLPLLTGPLEFAAQSHLPIPPYALGALLANGYLHGSGTTLTVNLYDASEIITRLRRERMDINEDQKPHGLSKHIPVLGIRPQIRALKLNIPSPIKFIPRLCFTASVAERCDLLQGLMDGDGSVSKTRNRVTYCSTSRQLAYDVQELVEGLGGIASVRPYDRTAEGKPIEYQVRMRLPSWVQPFSTTRKASRYSPDKSGNHARPCRTFDRIEYSREAESVCIAVDADDQLYATEHCILTHNTVSAIAMLTDPRTRPALVVTLTHLPKQWADELARFAPALSTHIVKSTTPYDLTAIRRTNGNGNGQQPKLPGTMPDVIIMNYHKLHGWAEHLRGLCRSVTFDEAQELRTGEGTGKYSAARLIAQAADFRLLMSGTPIYGYGGEFYNVLDCAKPGALGTRSEFIEEWCTGGDGGKPAIKDPKAFGSYLKDNGYMLLRTREDVGRELPSLIKIPHYIDADMDSLNTISRSCAELARLILKQGEARKGEKMMAAEEMSNKLRQATGIAKAGFVADFVRLLVEQGERVVLYGWHRACYEIWNDKLKDLEPAMFTGTESVNQKEESKQRFITGKTPLFMISLRAGAGLDGLQKVCRTVVVGELDWSPGVHEQGIGRVYRDGQPDPVTAYFLIAEVGSDPVISDILGIKTHQLSGVLHPEQELVEKLQVNTKDRMKRLAESYLAQLAKRG